MRSSLKERCDSAAAFERWRNFIVEERNSPEAMEPFTGVAPTDARRGGPAIMR